jgi:Ser/Thr protein kinase RdoA (MazF antagonist)
MSSSNRPPESVIRRYTSHLDTPEVSPLGQGSINDTFLLQTPHRTLVLQRINEKVFPTPEVLIHNLQQLNAHLSSIKDTEGQRWEDPVLLAAEDGALAVVDDNGSLWRALSHISNSLGFEQAQSLLQAEQTAWALGHFHRRVAGINTRNMRPPLPGFHSLSGYLEHYSLALAKHPPKAIPEVQFCLDIIEKRQEQALVLEHAHEEGKITQSIIHGDPKIANVLFDRNSQLAVSLIDLDTVGPGLRQHDIGDCLRSVCNTHGEDGKPGMVSFNLEYCTAALKGYFKAAGQLPHGARDHIVAGLQAICFELGLRFFTDFLQGGIYFKCNSLEVTLQKAGVQFALLEDVFAKEKTIYTILNTI